MNFANLLNAHLKGKIDQQANRLAEVKAKKPNFPDPVPVATVVIDQVVDPPVSVPEPEPAQAKSSVYIKSHGEDLTEFEEADPAVLADKVKTLAELIKNAKETIIYTGAGISTSAKLPDYRSTTGIWTMKEKNIVVEKSLFSAITSAQPTTGHTVINELVHKNHCKLVVSTNIDGLHRKSGVPAGRITELHGNCFVEYCSACKNEFYRDFFVVNCENQQTTIGDFGVSHETGRNCEHCGGALKDTVIGFGENLKDAPYQKATEEAQHCDLMICIGSSLRISPACNVPTIAFRNGAKLIIVNKQKTPFEDHCWLHIYGAIDDVMASLQNLLSLPE